MNRKMFHWTCTLQSESGEVVERKFQAFWSPEKDNVTSQSIADSCAAMESRATGKKHVGIAAQLIEA